MSKDATFTPYPAALGVRTIDGTSTSHPARQSTRRQHRSRSDVDLHTRDQTVAATVRS
jgi:hypothetical protein